MAVSEGSNILIILELEFFFIYILKLKLYSLHFTSFTSFKKCCSICNNNFSLTEEQDGVPEQVESMLGDAVSYVAFDLHTGILFIFTNIFKVYVFCRFGRISKMGPTFRVT